MNSSGAMQKDIDDVRKETKGYFELRRNGKVDSSSSNDEIPDGPRTTQLQCTDYDMRDSG